VLIEFLIVFEVSIKYYIGPPAEAAIRNSPTVYGPGWTAAYY